MEFPGNLQLIFYRDISCRGTFLRLQIRKIDFREFSRGTLRCGIFLLLFIISSVSVRVMFISEIIAEISEVKCRVN